MKQVMNKTMWMALALSASLLVTACGKKGGNSGPATTPVGQFGACGSCGFTQQLMVTTNSNFMGILQFTMRLIGDSAQIAAQGSMSSSRYNGPVMMDGTLVVTSQQFEGNCVIPAGTYALSTVQAGQMDYSGTIAIPQFQAAGPTAVLFRLRGGGLTGTYFGGVGKMYGQIDVLQAPDRYTGAITSCNGGYGGFFVY